MKAVFGVVVLLVVAGCDHARYSLVDNVAEAEKRFQGGRYAGFLDDAGAGDQSRIKLEGDTRPALTPPFPASLRFDVTLPDAAFLTLAPALITRQRVGRARVLYTVVVEAPDGERTTVLSELLRHTETNQWHPREVDLWRWAGQRVTLELTTAELEGRSDMLWADRVQAIWGEPVVSANPAKRFAAATHELVGAATVLLARQSDAAGLSREYVGSLWRFAVNAIIAGLLSIVIREVYRRFGSTSSGRYEFSNLFPLFTITTVVVIAVVRSSLALSLGLIGALSIVRFRSAIKSPEELVYLLFCASVGVALGAEQRLLALTSVVLVCAVVIVRHVGRRPADRNLVLTVSGDAARFYGGDASALDRVRGVTRALRLQRIDHDGDNVELRAIVTVDHDGGAALIARLRETLPEFRFSLVDADDIV